MSPSDNNTSLIHNIENYYTILLLRLLSENITIKIINIILLRLLSEDIAIKIINITAIIKYVFIAVILYY